MAGYCQGFQHECKTWPQEEGLVGAWCLQSSQVGTEAPAEALLRPCWE